MKMFHHLPNDNIRICNFSKEYFDTAANFRLDLGQEYIGLPDDMIERIYVPVECHLLCDGNQRIPQPENPWEEGDIYINVIDELIKNKFKRENPESEESEPTIDEVKARKVTELNIACQETICSGFMSLALGTSHKYESKIEDQINLMGAVQMGTDMLYRCWNPEGTNQEWYQHTKEQLQQVFLDGSIMVRQNLERVSDLKEQVENAETVEEIEAIAW